jgi:hypothetical protein
MIKNCCKSTPTDNAAAVFKVDMVYRWIREGSIGALGMPLNVQIIGRPWCQEVVIEAMNQTNAALLETK